MFFWNVATEYSKRTTFTTYECAILCDRMNWNEINCEDLKAETENARTQTDVVLILRGLLFAKLSRYNSIKIHILYQMKKNEIDWLKKGKNIQSNSFWMKILFDA